MDDIIDDYIVDITNCLQKHRGGASILEENCWNRCDSSFRESLSF